MKRHWSQKDREFIIKNLHVLPLPDIARQLNRTERALNLYLHRNRNDPAFCKKDNNLLIKLLERKFRDISCFQPTRSFFDSVKIGQKRYWAIYKGISAITEQELINIAAYFEIRLEEVYEVRQTSLFDSKTNI